MAENDDTRVTMEDLRLMRTARGKRGFCLQGVRAFCAKHGYSYDKFMAEGVPLSRLERVKDAMTQRVVAFVREQRGGE